VAKVKNEVASMTAGPNTVAISNECVEVIVDMTEEKRSGRLAAWSRHLLGADTATGGLLELVGIYLLIRLVAGRRRR